MKSYTATAALITVLIMAGVSSAATVGILYGGQSQETLTVSPEALISKQVAISRDPADITGANPIVRITVNSGSVNHRLDKVFLYECRKAGPADCSRLAPFQGSGFLDVERNWTSLSERLTSSAVPQAGNIMIIAKLVDSEENALWAGSFIQVRRDSLSQMPVAVENSLSNVELTATGASSVLLIRNFIESNGNTIIPFNSQYVSGAVFTSATSLYSIGASSQEIEQSPPAFQTAVSSSPEIKSISKDVQFIFPQTNLGIANPLVFVINPSPVTGDGFCDIGENSQTSCFDCGCAQGSFYCDLSNPSSPSGACRDSNAITLTAIAPSSVPLNSCTGQFSINMTAKISNPPSGLPSSLTGVANVSGSVVPLTCAQASGYGEYSCLVPVSPAVQCGGGTYSLEGSTLAFQVAYRDGPNTVFKNLVSPISRINVNYNCGCSSGLFCDSGALTCKSDAISVSMLEIRSRIDNYNRATDSITFSAKANNPPSDLVLTSVDYSLGSLNIDGTSIRNSTTGTINCAGGLATGFIYNCSIPFSISPYNPANTYSFKGNRLVFHFSYTNGPGNTITKDVSLGIADVTMPAQTCGNGVIDQGETQANCCIDALCSSLDLYCDRGSLGCKPEGNITLSIESIFPTLPIRDAEQPHTLNITAVISNPPKDFQIILANHKIAGQASGYDLGCTVRERLLGRVRCLLTIPAQENCTLPFCSVGPNSLELTITFPDGSLPDRTKTLPTSFPDIRITPTYHCGDGRQESSLNESAANCCLDFSCLADARFGPNYYCDYDPLSGESPECLAKDGIRLVVDSPTSPVKFSSCEVNSRLSVAAHIDGQPSRMTLENSFGIINGENADSVHCKKETLLGNATYNCTITVPAVPTCSKGDVYEYGPNSISFAISFQTGNRTRESRKLTAQLPNITIRQGTQSLFDISQSLSDQLESSLEDVQNQVERLEDIVNMCIALRLTGALATAAGPVWGSIVGARNFDDRVNDWKITDSGIVGEQPPTKPYETKQDLNEYLKSHPGAKSETIPDANFKNLPPFEQQQQRRQAILGSAQTGTLIGKSLTEGINSICTALEKYPLVMIQLEQLQIQQASVHTCLAIAQHSLDIGSCRGQEQACFANMQGCVNQIDRITSSSERISREISGISADITRSTDSVLNAYNQANLLSYGGAGYMIDPRTGRIIPTSRYYSGSATTPQLTVTCGGYPVGDGDSCCEYRKINNQQQPMPLSVLSSATGRGYCSRYQVRDAGSPVIQSTNVKDYATPLGYGTRTFDLWCLDEFGEDINIIDSISITFVDDPEDDGTCPGMGQSGVTVAGKPVETISGGTTTSGSSAISNFGYNQAPDGSLQVFFSTNQPCRAEGSFAIAGAGGFVINEDAETTNHVIVKPGVAPGIYDYSIKCAGAEQKGTITVGVPGTASASGISVTKIDVAPTTARIMYTTNVDCFGGGVNYGAQAKSSTSPAYDTSGRDHSVTISGLNPSTTYTYSLGCTISSSSSSVPAVLSSPDATFTTTA
ncbi:MAG: fibronectin type III domain-containing protein [Candidatus Aenigmarchaeota archaeon]|nr:fibronectin type III domain-containing protein [Candidatus Aenigmarchaeota archaeon]